MAGKLLLSLGFLAVGGLVALGVASALAGGGSAGQIASVVTGDDDSRVLGTDGWADEGGDDADDWQDSEDGVRQLDDRGDLEPGELAIAQTLADEFRVTQEEVLALYEQGIGFGAILKLYAIAEAKGVTVDELLVMIPLRDGRYDFAFGEMIKGLSEEERAVLASGPKNLGALVSASHRSEGAATKASHGQGPPGFAKALGRRWDARLTCPIGVVVQGIAAAIGLVGGPGA